jgi:hypothetical protein
MSTAIFLRTSTMTLSRPVVRDTAIRANNS